MYRSLAKEFNECHQNPVNILIHLVTVFGFYLSLASLFNGTIVLIYGISMGLFIDTFTIQFLTSVFLTGCFYASQYLTLPWLHALVLFAISYVIQDLAHYLTAEPTFQYRYTPTTPGSKIKTWSKFYFQLSLHSYFMLPLVLESATEIRLFEAMLSWFLVLDRMVKLKLNSPTATNNLKIIKKWLDQEGLAKDVTTHYWYSSLPYGIKKSFAQIANEHIIFDKFGNLFPAPLYTTQVLESMNEIYVAAIHTDDATSDNVFYSNHVDGPFMCYPFASVYRAIVAINSNDFIKTVFPAEPCEHILTDGEMWAFDFNREVHRIEQVKEASNQSLYYYGQFLGWLTSTYDTIARLAFLKTLRPKRQFEILLWRFIMFCTHLFYGSIHAAGNSGAISFVIGSAIITYFTKTELPLFMMTSSFIHYFIYIATYYFYETHKDKIVFDAFKSTVIFYKAVAFYHLIVHYIQHIDWFNIDWISLVMIASGFSLSGIAAATIGLDQTYFGAELGRMKPNRVSGFPYNITHHPMIIGNIIGLLGFYKLQGFREALPWLVPTHIVLYTIHMLQEHFDIKKTATFVPDYKIHQKEE